MRKQCEINKKAWNYKAYEWSNINLGTPEEVAKSMMENPEKWLRKHIHLLGDVNGKVVGNLLGSCGAKAIPLAILGAEVTVVDISEENQKYALEVARSANVDINYVISDLYELDTIKYDNYFDILYLEGGILHYFDDLNVLFMILYKILKSGGKLILNDGHPFHKILVNKNNYASNEDEIYGDYFYRDLIYGNVAYKTQFSEEEQKDFHDCLLRYYTMGEIITAVAQTGLIIRKLEEEPGSNRCLPVNYTLLAYKDPK